MFDEILRQITFDCIESWESCNILYFVTLGVQVIQECTNRNNLKARVEDYYTSI